MSTLKTLYIIRGLPGSGKSTLAHDLAPNANVAADDFFVAEGVYDFEPTELPAAHAWCQSRAKALLETHNRVAVHNTFTKGWEVLPYQRLAALFNARIFVISLFDAGLEDETLFERNTHDVPLHTIKRMRNFYVQHIPNPPRT